MGTRVVTNNTIIPETIHKFNDYIGNTNDRQVEVNPDTTNPYWTDYGWSSAQSTAFTDDWHDVWVDDLYPKWKNPLTKTTPVVKAVEKFMKDFKEWVKTEKLIDKIKSWNDVSVDDSLIWNFVLERKDPTHRTEPIEKSIFPQLAAAGGGVIAAEVRADKDETRPSIPVDEGADSVQYAWAIFDKREDTTKEGVSPDDMQKATSTRASFDFDAGMTNQGRWLVIYFRWYNTKHPNLAGKWSVMQVIAIS
jgi:hypothetical protein